MSLEYFHKIDTIESTLDLKNYSIKLFSKNKILHLLINFSRSNKLHLYNFYQRDLFNGNKKSLLLAWIRLYLFFSLVFS